MKVGNGEFRLTRLGGWMMREALDEKEKGRQ